MSRHRFVIEVTVRDDILTREWRERHGATLPDAWTPEVLAWVMRTHFLGPSPHEVITDAEITDYTCLDDDG